MSDTFPIAVLLMWTICVPLLFAIVSPSKAVLIGLFGGWLFLPVASVEIPGFTEFNKSTAVGLPVIIGALVFDPVRLLQIRLAWIDLFPGILMLSPIASSLLAGFGLYDGASWSVRYLWIWGLPYFIGRIYFRTPIEQAYFVKALVLSGLIYIPFILIEVWMSPQLHRWVYGYFPGAWIDARRMGGWRPVVFMSHGIMVGLFMCSCAVASLGILWSKHSNKIFGINATLVSVILLFGALLTKSAGAIMIAIPAIATLGLVRLTKRSFFFWAMIVIPLFYILSRLLFGWRGDLLVTTAADLFGEERADSLWTRLNSEYQLCQLASEKLLFGASRMEYVGMRIEGSRKSIIADGLWIILLGKNGIVGLTACFGMMLCPCALFGWKIPVRLWMTRDFCSCLVLCVTILMFAIDCLLNAMINPIHLVACGSVVSRLETNIWKR